MGQIQVYKSAHLLLWTASSLQALSLDPVPIPLSRTQATLTSGCRMTEKALLYLGEQLPWVAKSQKTPSSENGLEKGVS